MTSKATIKSEIVSKIGGTQYGIWRIGLTHDLAARKTYWGEAKKESVTHWKDWKAESLSDAQDLESHFINKGMKGGTGGDLSSGLTTFIYVF